MRHPWKPSVFPILTALMFLLNCGRTSFVVLKLETGSTPLSAVTILDFDLELGGRTDKVSFAPGGEISFPASATLEIGGGEGMLGVQVSAKNAAGQQVGHGSGTVDVIGSANSELIIQIEPGPPPPPNPALSGLSFSAGTLSPAFAPDTLAYTLSVPAFIGSVQVTAIADNPAATLLVNSSPVASGVASAAIAVENGVTMISIAVKLPGTADRVYGVAMMRSPSTYLKASNTGANDQFGRNVSLSGDTLAIGADGEGSNATGVDGNQTDNSSGASGAVYVFVRSGSTWTQQAYLKASNTESSDQFGSSVSLSGDTLAVGAESEDSSATGVNGNQADNSSGASGAVYVFVRNGSTWTQQAYLKASNTEAGDQFGSRVSLSGDTLAVGARFEDSNATGIDGNQADNSSGASGAVYVFVRSGSTWTQQAYLKASNTAAIDNFGFSVSLSGDTLAVGAVGEDSNATSVDGNQADNSLNSSGAVYVFVRSGSTWAQQAYLKASNTDAGDQFGSSVSLSGDTLAVGAKFEASNATGVNGNQADNSASFCGAVYVFVRSGSTWTHQAYLKASNAQVNDQFGSSVSLSGDRLAVGAIGEDSNATGVNGNQLDNSAASSGAVYVFVRSGSTWTQQAYLKASNTEADDQFGTDVTLSLSLSLSGDMLAVGAALEDSNAAGVNGNQADNGASASGAVYVF